MASIKERIAGLRERYGWIDHVVRMQEHFGSVKAGQQAGAITYFAFLSFFPILALAFFTVGVVSTVVDGADDALRSAIESLFPRMIGPGEGQLQLSDFRTFTGLAGKGVGHGQGNRLADSLRVGTVGARTGTGHIHQRGEHTTMNHVAEIQVLLAYLKTQYRPAFFPLQEMQPDQGRKPVIETRIGVFHGKHGRRYCWHVLSSAEAGSGPPLHHLFYLGYHILESGPQVFNQGTTAETQ